MSRSVQNAFEQNLIKQSKETAWRNYGKFVNKFDLSVDNIHNLNLKFINVNLSNKFCPRLSDHVIEYTNYVELLQTCGNMELNKVIMVFADLCSQLTDLSEIAYRDFVGPLSLYAENRSDSSSGSESKKSNEDLTEMSKFIGVLYDMLCFTNRCMTVSQSFVQQIEALFTVYKKTKSNENKGSIDLDNFKLDIVLEHFSRMIVALINIDELISNHSAIQKDFVNYKRMVELASKDVTSFQLDPSETQKVSTLFAMVKVIEKELIDGGTILNRLIDTVTSATQANGPLFTNSQISEQFLNFIKTQIADFEADCLKTADGTKWLSICGLFVIYIWLFKKDDKRMFRNILESQRKTNMLQVHLKGNVTVLPEKLLCSHLPKAMADKKLIDLIVAQREAMMRVSLEREVKQMQLQLVTWIIAFESAMSRVADSGLNLIENLKTKQIKALVEGLELALLTSQLVRNFIFLHLHFGKAMSRQNIVHICRLLNVLKTIEVSFDRKKGVLLQISNSYAQYNSLLALEALSSMKKRLLADVTKYSEKKLDTLSAVILASNCINGPILTESRQIITAICLAFIGNAMTDADSSRILGSFRKIEQTSKVLSLLKWNTSTEFLYFNRNIIGTFYSHLHEHGNIREIRYFSLVLEDCLNFLHFSTEYDEVRQKLLKSTFEDEMAASFKDQFLTKFCTAFETELRLQTHLELKLDDRSPFKRPLFDFASPLSCEPFRLLDRFVSIRNVVQDHLSEMTYNLTTIALHDWKTYESILNLSRTKYGLNFVASQLPTQTLEQGLDVLEITRKIDVFVSRYLYNLNNQMFIEKSSDNKHLNVLLIRHVANSIQTHGFGIINTAVNFTYQFLRKKVHIFSQFLFDEHVKSRLLKDLRFFRESKSSKFPYERAEKFVKDIRKLGLTPDGLSFLDQFRQVITEIGNALGFVRMLRSGALHCSSASVAFVPDVEELSDISFEAMATEEHFTGECLQAAQNLDSVLKTLNSNFGEATDFFKVLVDVFVTLRDQKNFYHLKNFHIILPALTVNYVEWSVMSKEKMNRKNKNGAQFTDDGFEMGVAYLLCLLEQFTEFESVHWFGSVREKITIERNEAIKEKNAIQTVNQLSDKLRQTTSLTLKRLDVLQNEFDLLNYNLTACKILFSGSITK